MTPMKSFLAPAILASALLLCPAPTFAQDTTTEQPATGDTAAPMTMAEVEKAWTAGDYVAVRKGLKYLAETEGTALAQYRYGRVLVQGHGGPRDTKAAVEWLKKAVAQDNMDAAVLLARVYLSIKTDEAAKAALPLLSRAAARGNAEGQYYLALMQQTGRGGKQDLESAFNWLLAASENGHVEAQFQLARAYSRGQGIEKSNAQTERWLTEAANNGHVKAQFFLALAFDRGQGVKQDHAAALKWYRRAAEAGHTASQREVGLHYMTGSGTQQNIPEAQRWLTEAAKHGDARAQMAMGKLHLDGPDYGLPQSDERAAKWFKHAAAQTWPDGLIALSRMTEAGRGVEQDLPAAVNLLLRAVREADYDPARLRLGELAGEGKLDGLVAPQTAVPWAVMAIAKGNLGAMSWLEKQAAGDNRPARTALATILQDKGGDEARIAALFGQAAEEGDARAQFQMGMLYTTGAGVELDYVQAHKWFNIAAAQGIDEAVEQRALLGQLMTPEQVAEAQTSARDWMARDGDRAPQTEQEVSIVPGKGRIND